MTKITIRQIKTFALKINRTATQEKQYVYIAVANKAIKYKYGKSKIVYIGETKMGAFRLASSAAERSHLFTEHGISSLTYYIVVPKPRSKIKSWQLLETALILTFRSKYGDVSKANSQGKGIKTTESTEREKHKYFTTEKLEKIIKYYSYIE